jgi:hypothetical protein
MTDIVAELDGYLADFSRAWASRDILQRARAELVALRRLDHWPELVAQARAEALEEAARFMESKGVPQAFTAAIRALKDKYGT